MLSISGGDDAAAREHHESGGFSGGSSEVGGSGSVPGVGGMDESERSGGGGGGNRWPRQETLALLKIRSDMDVAFRDSNLKGPLWEEVSRKMAELGFQRSAKKCKEKFENVFKYHKRTKDGRQSKPDAKSYRFFDQLEALENTPPPTFAPPIILPPPSTTTTRAVAAPQSTATSNIPSHANVSSNTSSPTPLRVVSPNMASPTQIANNNPINASSLHIPPPPLMNNPNLPPILSNLTSSSTSSDEDIQRKRGKKRKWKDYFQRLLNDVIHKQEEMQKKFLDILEKRERDRMAREEAWRVQDMARMNREHEILVQERNVAAAKDTAVIAFLQKVTEQHDLQIPITKSANAQPPQVTKQAQPPVDNPQQPPEKPQPPPPPAARQSNFQQAPPSQVPQAIIVTPTKMSVDATKTDNGGDILTPTSSSRWPKEEIEALIKLRTDLEIKYQENGPKGPLWEEISAGMGRLGYNRSSKRCKEKWENINKYFKKVKESSKKRPEDSKTCPYFHQLDALYKEKAKNDVVSSFNVPGFLNPMVPIMAQPEQQWPLPPQQPLMPPPPEDSVMHGQNNNDSDNNDHEDEDDDDGEEDEEDDGGGRYEIVTNKQQPFSGTN